MSKSLAEYVKKEQGELRVRPFSGGADCRIRLDPCGNHDDIYVLVEGIIVYNLHIDKDSLSIHPRLNRDAGWVLIPNDEGKISIEGVRDKNPQRVVFNTKYSWEGKQYEEVGLTTGLEVGEVE